LRVTALCDPYKDAVCSLFCQIILPRFQFKKKKFQSEKVFDASTNISNDCSKRCHGSRYDDTHDNGIICNDTH
jgi:hypothetical protein